MKMGRQTEFDGVVYCDWRINVRNCVDEEVFFGFQAFGTVTYFLTVIIMTFIIIFRVCFSFNELSYKRYQLNF